MLLPDINGRMRGKWLPADSADKLAAGKVRLPLSTYALDIFGEDVDEAGLAQATGDPDGAAHPVAGTEAPVPWAEGAAQALVTLRGLDGAPCAYCPRTVLAGIVERFAAHGLTPVVATELELYLHRPGGGPPEGMGGAQVYDLDATDRAGPFLDRLRAACEAQGIPVDAAIAEYGPGQVEVNLLHVPDALAAADDAVLFKRAAKACARAEGMGATFMAKPYGNWPGSGMHVHVSLERDGGNAFADDRALLDAAVAGCVATMPDLTAIFAPHLNSYRRLQPGQYAPVTACWAEEHRGAAVRLPEAAGEGARLEHRLAGADANPYLVLAAVLGGMLEGIEGRAAPSPPLPHEGEPLPHDWRSAVARLDGSAAARSMLGDEMVRVYAAMRRQEMARLAAIVPDVETDTYRERL